MNVGNKLINKNLLVVTLVVLILHINFVSKSEIMGLLALIEFFILLLSILVYGSKQFLLLLLLFTSISFDVIEFVGPSLDSLYSVSNLPFLGFLGYFGLILLAFIRFFKSRKNRLKINNVDLFKLLKFSAYIIFSGILMAGVVFSFNDNSIPFDSVIFFFKNDFGKYFTISATIILYILQICSDHHFHFQLKQYLSTIIVAIVLAAPISVLSGYNGFYGDSETILMPLTFFFSTCTILFLFDDEYKKYKVYFFVCALIAIYIQFFHSNSLGGKSWLVLIFIAYFLFAKQFKMTFKISFIAMLLILLSGISITNNGAVDSEASLLDKKLSEAMSMLAFTSANYYENMSDSPKARVDEFINVLDEFKEKPILSIFGKGFGGSVKDHNNLFGSFKASYFSDREYSNNSFVFLHESINVIFLKFGWFGLFLFFTLVLKISKNELSNPWLSIGFVWFIFFFGYTISLGVFGVSSLVLGLYETNLSKRVIEAKEADRRSL
jgi:hypothetical protein